MKILEQVGEKSYLLTMGGGGVAAVGGASTHDVAIMVGMGTALVGLLVQCVYTFLKNRRETKLHQLQIKKLNDS